MTLPMENEAARGPSAPTSPGDLGPGRRPGKAAGAFRTISEVATDLNVPQHVLRFWETRFTQIRPLKRAGGRRYYRPEDVDLLRRIRQLLYNNGYTIKGVQRLLRDLGRQDAPGRADAEANGDAEIAAAEPDALEPPQAAAAEEPAMPRADIEAALNELLEVREMLRRARG
ncbi:MAG TPA: MerR family transcriptional regulator [Alphaproteobacteria bacterium]